MKKLFAAVLCVLVLLLSGCADVTAPADNNAENAISTESTNVAEVESTTNNSEWKQFIKEYNEWADKYIDIMNKYKKNPTDLSILSDYTSMISGVAEWSEKSEKISGELAKASSKELAEYSSELLKISAKIAEAAY